MHRLARTERESIRLRPPSRVCVVAAQRQLSALHRRNNSCPRGDESDQTIKTCFVADLTTTAASSSCFLRARAPCESESSLLVQRLALPSSPGRAALLLIAQPGVDHSSYRGVQIRVMVGFCCYSPMKKIKITNHDKVAHRITMWWDFLPVENPISFRFQSQKMHTSRP